MLQTLMPLPLISNLNSLTYLRGRGPEEAEKSHQVDASQAMLIFKPAKGVHQSIWQEGKKKLQPNFALDDLI